MRFSQRLLDENKRSNQEKRKKNDDLRRADDEDVETLIYDQPPKWGYLNDTKSVFASDMGNGINTNPDVFERTAIFHTKKKEEPNMTGGL